MLCAADEIYLSQVLPLASAVGEGFSWATVGSPSPMAGDGIDIWKLFTPIMPTLAATCKTVTAAMPTWEITKVLTAPTGRCPHG